MTAAFVLAEMRELLKGPSRKISFLSRHKDSPDSTKITAASTPTDAASKTAADAEEIKVPFSLDDVKHMKKEQIPIFIDFLKDFVLRFKKHIGQSSVFSTLRKNRWRGLVWETLGAEHFCAAMSCTSKLAVRLR